MAANSLSRQDGSKPLTEQAAAVGLRGYRTLDPDRSAGRRREILHAAARVFARDGYHAATTDDIARAMGVTKGVIYYYFRAKEDIFEEVVSTAIEGAYARLEAVLCEPGTAPEVLRRALTTHIEYNLNDAEEGYY